MAPKQPVKGQKQIDAENTTNLQFYSYVIFGVLGVYGIVRFILFKASLSWLHYMASVMVLSTYGCGYMFMRSIANQGIDLNMPSGMAEHSKDLILLTCIVQSLSLVSDYFWLLLLLVPIRAFHLVWVNFLGPWFFAEAPAIDEKAQKKMDKKMKRNNMMYR